MISIRNLDKHFETKGAQAVQVLRDINLDVPDRTITAVIGPSGAGKTTLSKCISLLERPSSGSVLVNGKNLSGLRGPELRHERRAIGTIFQSSALLRRKTAAENVALPLEYLGVVRADIERRVAELLDHVGLADKANLYPAQLSGGQRQRVGIARALALHPQVLLSDEATSGLDPQSTESILALLRNLRDEFNLSIILITHEMDVVRSIADNVAVLRAGQIVESGPVAELVGNPASQIGRQLLPMRIEEGEAGAPLSFEVSYGTDRAVPDDWIDRVGNALQVTVRLHGAIVEKIHGRQAGRVHISLESRRQGPLNAEEAEAAVRYLGSLGLHATALGAAARTGAGAAAFAAEAEAA